MINRLFTAGLIKVQGTSREQQYPERTSYEATEAGRAAARQWLDEIIREPRNEFPEFPAALSFLPMITPESTLAMLSKRREPLAQRLAALDGALATTAPEGYEIPRVVMLETEYLRAVTEVELRWVDAVIAQLRDGTITWSREELQVIAARWMKA